MGQGKKILKKRFILLFGQGGYGRGCVAGFLFVFLCFFGVIRGIKKDQVRLFVKRPGAVLRVPVMTFDFRAAL
jgi:hypothetical protein